MSLLGQMDRAVYATRIDRLLFMKVQPRTFRWTPLFLLVALLVGYVLMARTESSPNRSFFLGWLLFYAAYLGAAFLRIFGPRFVPTSRAPLDERELMVKARAYAISGIAVTCFAMLGCSYMAAADLIGFWHPHLPNDWISLAFGIQAVAMLLPTFIASWLEPRPAADPDE